MVSTISDYKDKCSNAYMIHIFNLEAFHPISLHTFEFERFETNENRVYFYTNGNILFGFKLEAKSLNDAHVYLTIPEDFRCIHFDGNMISKIGEIKSGPDTHLSYHGRHRKKKISGEIHVTQNKKRIGAGYQNKIEAPLLRESQLNIYPLPICKLYFNSKSHFINTSKRVHNYIQLEDIPILSIR